MGKLKQLISTVLVLTMLATTVPIKAIAEGTDVDSSTQNQQTQLTVENLEPKIISEAVEKEDKYTKQFQKSDGSYEVAIYKSPINYLENGTWKTIDNSFQEINGDNNEKVLQNKANDFKVNFAKNSESSKLVDLKKDKYQISWGLQGQKTTDIFNYVPDNTKTNDEIKQVADDKVKEDTKYKSLTAKQKSEAKDIMIQNNKKEIIDKAQSDVCYSDILTNVDLEYSLIGDKLKESIVIKDRIANAEFKFKLSIKNVQPILNQDGSIIFYDSKDSTKQVFTIEAPFMQDAKDSTSDNVKLQLDKDSDGNYVVTIKPDKAWLYSKDREYPIVLDPPISTSTARTDIHDTFVCSLDSSEKAENIYLRAGKNISCGVTRTFINFKLPSIKTGDMITSAYLYLSPQEENYNGSRIEAHKVTSGWNTTKNSDGTWDTYGLRYSNQPSFDTTVVDYSVVNTSSNNMMDWDITSIVKNWYSSGVNNGLMLKNEDESLADTAFASSDIGDAYANQRPCILMNYVNNSGLQDYWTYHSQSIGRGGTGYVNDYNGNLVFEHNDLSMSGTKMPVNIEHVFNSNDRDQQMENCKTVLGLGWRLNYSQRVDQTDMKDANGVPYYKYTDGTGTRHYFLYDKTIGKFKDESGLELNMTLPDYRAIITDKSNNQLIFTSDGKFFNDGKLHYILTNIVDKNGNKLTINYDSNNYLSSITDGAGRVTKILTDQWGTVASIVDPSGKSTQFGYYGGYLTRITYPDGKVTTFTYDSNNNLTCAKNCDGYEVNYSYYSSSPYRVSKVSEANADGTTGGSLSLGYDYNTTIFTDALGRKNVYQFNDCGNTICEKDNDGSAQYYKYLVNQGTASNTNYNNKVSVTSKLQKTINNYIINHNVGMSCDWNISNPSNLGNCGYSTDTGYMGSKSLKIEKTSTISLYDYCAMQQNIALKRGCTYNFSAYVKTSNITSGNGKGACLFISYRDGSGNYQTVTSNYVQGTNDWQRIDMEFTMPSDAAYDDAYPGVQIQGETGTAYFSALQLEDGLLANRYNLIENGNYESGSIYSPDFWLRDTQCTTDDSIVHCTDTDFPSALYNTCFKIQGSSYASKQINQTVNVSGNAGDCFVLGGWGKGQSVSLSNNSGNTRLFGLEICLRSKDTSKPDQWQYVPFNQSISSWQYASERVIANNDYKSAEVYALYYYNDNTAYFGNIQLYKEEFGQSFEYDDKGNVVATADLAKQKSKFEYDGNNNLIKNTDPKGNSFNYTYDNNHNITKATTAENIAYSFSYDSSGNPTKASLGDSSNLIQSSAAYTASENYIKSLTDSAGDTSSYDYNETTGQLSSTTDPNGSSTYYSYDSMGKTAEVYKYSGNTKLEIFPLNGGVTGSKGTAPNVDTSRFEDDGTGKQVFSAQSGSTLSYNLGIVRDSGTLSAWFNPKVNTKTVRYFITNNGSNDEILYLYLDENNCLNAAVRDINSNWYIYSTSKPLTENAWTCMALTWHYTNSVFSCSLYINGQKQQNVKPDINIKDFSNGSTTIGSLKNGTNNFLGSIDQFSYSNTELSDSDIAAVYNAGRANCINSNYTYTNDKLTRINTNGVNYNFEYDSLGNNTKVSVGNQKLIENTYDNVSGRLTKSTYGNDQYISSDYDSLDRVIAKRYNGNITDTYMYDASGNLGQHNDITNDAIYRYIYDTSDRLVKLTDSLGNIMSYGYDENNNTSTIFDKVNTKSFSKGNITSYGYDKDNKPVEVTFDRNNLNDASNEYFPLNGDTMGTKGTKAFNAKPVFSKDDGKTVLQLQDASNGQSVEYNLGISKNSGTMGLWFKTTKTGTVRYILSNKGSADQILYMYLNSDDKLKLGIRDSAGNWNELLSSNSAVSPNQWYFAAVSWNVQGGNLNCSLYLNNSCTSKSTSNFKDFSNANTAVGSYLDGTNSINGCIEDLTYSPSTLDSTAITKLYNSGRGVTQKTTYDTAARTKNKILNLGATSYTTSYSYKNNADGTTTTLLAAIDNNGTSISYEYDKNGNISTITQNGNAISYHYNELNELVREDNAVLGKTITYTYDAGGNITAKAEYPYTKPTDPVSLETKPNTIEYKYDSNWKDELASYNGLSITYDQIGNPLNDGKWNYSWQQGRQLAGMIGNGNTISYKYNDSGIRTQKTVNGVTTNYRLVGNKVTYESNGTDNVYYTYDSNNDLVSMNLNGVEYYYVRNGQNDIIGLIDGTGAQVVSYTYDSWGKLISIDGILKDTVGVKNPYRYRGYRYDTETGLYYLNSRYYSPEWGRFINADTIVGNTGELLSHNVFAYCANNPIMRSDEGGYFWHIIVGAAVGALISGTAQVFSNAINHKPLTEGLASALITGAVSGALASTGVGLLGQIAGNAAISMAGNAINQIGNKKFDVGDMVYDGVVGGVSGAIGGAGIGGKSITHLENQIVKRTYRAAIHEGIEEGEEEFVKATRYYLKNSKGFYSTLYKGMGKGLITSGVSTVSCSNLGKGFFYSHICAY